jgi:hypothetical protein
MTEQRVFNTPTASPWEPPTAAEAASRRRDRAITEHTTALRNLLTAATNDRINSTGGNAMAEVTMQQHRRLRDEIARLREKLLVHNN